MSTAYKQMQVVGSYVGVGLQSLAHKRSAFLEVPGVKRATVWKDGEMYFLRLTVTGRHVLQSDGFQAVVHNSSLVHGVAHPEGLPVGAKKVRFLPIV